MNDDLEKLSRVDDFCDFENVYNVGLRKNRGLKKLFFLIFRKMYGWFVFHILSRQTAYNLQANFELKKQYEEMCEIRQSLEVVSNNIVMLQNRMQRDFESLQVQLAGHMREIENNFKRFQAVQNELRQLKSEINSSLKNTLTNDSFNVFSGEISNAISEFRSNYEYIRNKEYAHYNYLIDRMMFLENFNNIPVEKEDEKL